MNEDSHLLQIIQKNAEDGGTEVVISKLHEALIHREAEALLKLPDIAVARTLLTMSRVAAMVASSQGEGLGYQLTK